MNFFKKKKNVQPKEGTYAKLSDISMETSPLDPTMKSPYAFGTQPQVNYYNPSLNAFGTPAFSSNQFYATPAYQPGTYGPKPTTNITTSPYPGPVYSGKQVYPTFEQKPTPTTINLGPPNQMVFNDVVINNYQQPTPPIKKTPKKNYYNKPIPGTIPIERTPIIGTKEMDMIEFDDYFEKHVDKFLTPEVDEIFLYFTSEYLVGVQFCYRDSWGRQERETYKGNRHMSKSENLKNYYWSSMKMDFDEYIKEVYGEGETHVTYLKVVTNKGKTIECGIPSGRELKNLIPELSKVIGVGGSYGMCISNIYFYYT